MKKEGLWKIVYMAFLFALFASMLIAGLFFAFISFVPFEELTRMLETLWDNPGLISAAAFAELFMLLFVIEIFRLVFESGSNAKVKSEKTTAKKTTRKSTKKKSK